MTHIETPVLVVGAGPAGMTAALLLSRLGISSRIIERRAAPQSAPAAHVVNARTFEIFRAAGVDMQAIAAACQDPARWGRQRPSCAAKGIPTVVPGPKKSPSAPAGTRN